MKTRELPQLSFDLGVSLGRMSKFLAEINTSRMSKKDQKMLDYIRDEHEKLFAGYHEISYLLNELQDLRKKAS